VTLQKGSYDATQDILTVYLIDPSNDKNTFNIFDLNKVSIDIPTTP
jgi:hypothetical protein